MAEHIASVCPNCQRSLRIRTDYLGKRIACKFCDYAFVAIRTTDHAAAENATEQAAEQLQQLERDRKSLRDELERHKQELVSLRQERDKAAQQIKALTEARDHLAAQCSEGPRAYKQLEERFQAESKRLTQDLQQACQQEGAASKRVKELEGMVKALMQEAAAHQQQRDLLVVQCSEGAKAHKQLEERFQAENKRLTQDLQQVRQQEGAASKRVQELEGMVKALKQEAATHQQQRDRLAVQCSEGAKAYKQLEERFQAENKRLTQDLQQVRQQEGVLSKCIKEFEVMVKALKQEAATHQQHRDRLAAQCSEGARAQKQMEERFQAENKRLTQDLQQVRQQEEAASKRAKEFEVMVAAQMQEAATHQQQRDRLAAQCSEQANVQKQLEERFQAENKRLTLDLQQVRQQEGTASKRVKELEVEVEALKKEAATQREVAALPERGARAVSDDQDRAAAERQIWQKQMEATLGQFDQERRQLCKAYERLRQEVNDMRAGRVSTGRAPK